MKKTLIIILSLVLTLSLGVTAFAMISDFKNDENASKELELVESLEDSSENIFYFRTYIEENPDFKLSEESLAKLYNELDAVIEKYDAIELPSNYFVNGYMVSCKNLCKEGCEQECEKGYGCRGMFADYELKTVDGTFLDFIISTDEDADSLKYAMFLSYITYELPHNVIYSDYRYYEQLIEYGFVNRGTVPELFVSYDYIDLGYESAFDYLKAVDNGEAEMGDNSYFVHFSSGKYIFKATESYFDYNYLWPGSEK